MNHPSKFSNLLKSIPEETSQEIFQHILSTPDITIERIISHGQASPEEGWYDQETNEWVMVIDGKAIIELEDGKEIPLEPFDFLLLKAHQKHRVKWTEPNRNTVWLAIHFPG